MWSVSVGSPRGRLGMLALWNNHVMCSNSRQSSILFTDSSGEKNLFEITQPRMNYFHILLNSISVKLNTWCVCCQWEVDDKVGLIPGMFWVLIRGCIFPAWFCIWQYFANSGLRNSIFYGVYFTHSAVFRCIITWRETILPTSCEERPSCKIMAIRHFGKEFTDQNVLDA